MPNHLNRPSKSQSVKLSVTLLAAAQKCALRAHRSKAGQIEYWALSGKLAEENPDLPFNFIQDALASHYAIEDGETMPFEFSDELKNR